MGEYALGHSISKDLMHWEHLAPAIVRDTLGHIFPAVLLLIRKMWQVTVQVPY